MYIKDKFQGYNIRKFRQDILAGVLVGVIALPMGMSFAVASGAPPVSGLYTMIIAGFLISLLGGSKYQIGGPAGAFIPVLFGIVVQYGFENLIIAGMMAGILLILFAICNAGSLMKYIPKTVITGFTAGTAVIIFSGQIAGFLGLNELKKYKYFYLNMKEILVNLTNINVYSVITAITCLALIIIGTKLYPRIPNALIGILASTLLATFLFPNQVATIEEVFGNIPNQLPMFDAPEITFDKIVMLLPVAFTISLLGGMESLLTATVADEMSGTKHNRKKELIGQGIANIVTPFFGGIPAAGGITRTATNINSGAVSRLSGMIHAILALLVLLIAAPYVEKVPLASLAPVVMVIAWNMGQRKAFAQILRSGVGNSLILLATFTATVFVDLTMGIGLGLAISLFIHLKNNGWRINTSGRLSS
ncbi:sulfate permease, SulP family [Marininema mesophilum]|uniref:Sulfate permease, SulP family n=1 Tax=Marininema mesophilum TaxID=1048340 RepID=A0A1H2ZX43_9BACL|nr:SulP family inorganic anion transporter [Marininema mesophilum]SDX22050.1 sulfate permease, SulP family [Marininema mesophilum]